MTPKAGVLVLGFLKLINEIGFFLKGGGWGYMYSESLMTK